MDILLYPHPTLRETARPVGTPPPEIAALAREMTAFMREHGGIGLAAPQVGVSKRLIVVSWSHEPEIDRAFVDPRITARRGAEDGDEGCLSFPGIRAQIRRSAWIRLEATTPEGEPVTVEVEGLLARVIQHEIDHLDGILLSDRMSPADRRMNLAALRDLEARFAAAAS